MHIPCLCCVLYHLTLAVADFTLSPDKLYLNTCSVELPDGVLVMKNVILTKWHIALSIKIGVLNSLYVKGTFMCPPNTSALCDRHIYVPADVIQSYEVNSEAKQAFGISPCLLSSNKCRPHLSTYIAPRGRQERAVLVRDCS